MTKADNFLLWLTLASSQTRIIPMGTHFLVLTRDMEEADELWQQRHLSGLPVEILVGRQYTPSIEFQD